MNASIDSAASIILEAASPSGDPRVQELREAYEHGRQASFAALCAWLLMGAAAGFALGYWIG